MRAAPLKYACLLAGLLLSACATRTAAGPVDLPDTARAPARPAGVPLYVAWNSPWLRDTAGVGDLDLQGPRLVEDLLADVRRLGLYEQAEVMDEPSARPGAQVLILSPVQAAIRETPTVLWWPNTAVWFFTWLPSLVVPDLRYTAEVRVAYLLVGAQDDALEAQGEFVVRTSRVLSPLGRGAGGYWGLLRYWIDAHGRPCRYPLSESGWHKVSAQLQPEVSAALRREVLGALLAHLPPPAPEPVPVPPPVPAPAPVPLPPAEMVASKSGGTPAPGPSGTPAPGPGGTPAPGARNLARERRGGPAASMAPAGAGLPAVAKPIGTPEPGPIGTPGLIGTPVPVPGPGPLPVQTAPPAPAVPKPPTPMPPPVPVTAPAKPAVPEPAQPAPTVIEQQFTPPPPPGPNDPKVIREPLPGGGGTLIWQWVELPGGEGSWRSIVMRTGRGRR